MSTTGSSNLNSKYAWRELVHRGLPKRSAQERVSDCLEIYGLYDEETAREQASRCIQCPNPSCVGGCPLCNPIPQWMRLTAEGRFLEAASFLGSATNLADICVRLCPKERLCEDTCLLNGISEPVAIGAIEQFLVEYACEHGQVDISTPPPCGRSVAVVGSGLGGLACADALASQGYSVTVFDSAMLPGGLLVSGMPAFKVEKAVVQRRVEMLRKKGVTFQLGIAVGEQIGLGELRASYDAVFLGFDSRKARSLAIPGAGLNGVMQAVPFILERNTPLLLGLPPLGLEGKRIVVIGAGDTAMDAVRTALRCGPQEVICVYRRDEAEMPCTRHDYENALEEGAQFLFQTAPVAVLGDDAGLVKGLRLVRTELSSIGADGRRACSVQPATEFEIEADCVIEALGFDPLPCSQVGDFSDLVVNNWGGLVVDDHQMTNLPGVFAAGDIVRGPSMALYTVRDARRAAAGIHSYLAAHPKKGANN